MTAYNKFPNDNSQKYYAQIQELPGQEENNSSSQKEQFRYHGTPVKITQGLAGSTLKKWKTWNMGVYITQTQGTDLQPRISCASKLTILS